MGSPAWLTDGVLTPSPVAVTPYAREDCVLPPADAQGHPGGVDELAAASVALVRTLGQHPAEHLIDLRRQVRPQHRRHRGRLLHMRPDDRRVQVLLKRNPPGQALIQHAAQRILISQPQHRRPPDLLRRHVIDRAQELPRRRQPAARHRVLGDPEVRQVHVIRVAVVAAPLDQQVPRLDVPVHQPLTVRGIQRPRGLAQQEQRGLRLQAAPLLDHLPQVSPGHVPHRDIQQLILGAHVVDRDHVRVVQRRGDPGLLQEPGPEHVIGSQLRRQHLQRDDTAQPQVLRLVDHAHPAAAEHRARPVARELIPHQRQPRHHAPLPGSRPGPANRAATRKRLPARKRAKLVT